MFLLAFDPLPNASAPSNAVKAYAPKCINLSACGINSCSHAEDGFVLLSESQVSTAIQTQNTTLLATFRTGV